MPDLSGIAAQAGAMRHFLTFRLDDRVYALPAEDVSEVIRIPVVARMPQSPKGLMGLANLRGSILPIASGRSLLGQPEAILSSSARAIVLAGASPVALAVDAITALVELAAASIETRQLELSALPGEVLRGAFQSERDGPVIKLLDLPTLLRSAFIARQRPQKKVQASAKGLPQDSDIEQGIRTKMVSFAVAGQEYAFPLEVVQEVVSAPPLLAAIPHSEALVLGVATLRDALLPLLSLRGLLGFSLAADHQREKVVVARVGGNVVGLVVDEMRALFEADESRMDAVPGVLASRTGGESRIDAIYRSNDGKGLISILSPEHLFGADIMRKLSAVQASAQSEPTVKQDATLTRQHVVFRVGEEEFGLPIESVDEVARVPEQIARVPNTPKFLEGVVNLRGEVVPVVDQRKRFNMPSLPTSAARRLIVVRTQRHTAGLIVDSVSEVLRTPIDSIEEAPDLTGETTKLVQGVVNLHGQNRIVLLLDPAELLTRGERELLDKFGKQQNAPERSKT